MDFSGFYTLYHNILHQMRRLPLLWLQLYWYSTLWAFNSLCPMSFTFSPDWCWYQDISRGDHQRPELPPAGADISRCQYREYGLQQTCEPCLTMEWIEQFKQVVSTWYKDTCLQWSSLSFFNKLNVKHYCLHVWPAASQRSSLIFFNNQTASGESFENKRPNCYRQNVKF